MRSIILNLEPSSNWIFRFFPSVFLLDDGFSIVLFVAPPFVVLIGFFCFAKCNILNDMNSNVTVFP